MLNVKKLLTKLITVEANTITPQAGSSYSGYGGCYYRTVGKMAHVHIGVSGLTANTNHTIATLPSGIHPSTSIISQGRGANTNSLCYGSIDASGNVVIQSTGSYAEVDFVFIMS